MKKLVLIAALAGFALNMGCLKKDDDDDGGGGVSYPSFTVTAMCTEAGDPANCTVAGNGGKIYFAVGATCSDIMSDTVGPMISSSSYNAMACSDLANDTCSGNSTGLGWEADGVGSPVFGGVTFAAAAWFDTTPDTPVGDPGSGDVICCQEGFSISDGATLNVTSGCMDFVP